MKFIKLLCERLRSTSDQVERFSSGREGWPVRCFGCPKASAGTDHTRYSSQEMSEMVGMTGRHQQAIAADSDLGAMVVLNAKTLREMAEAGAGHEGE